MNRRAVETPLGWLTLHGAEAVTAVTWDRSDGESTETLDQAADEVSAYFAGTLRAFSVPLNPGGTPFQSRFYTALCSIPFGDTLEYGDLAKRLGVSAQAIGQSCGANPIPILIPCHRVLSRSGLGGYSGAGGVETKIALLRHEGAAGLLI